MECPICGSDELEILNSKDKSSKKKFIEEYLLKCESVADVLVKIARGVYVSPEERLKAFKDAIELINYETSRKDQ